MNSLTEATLLFGYLVILMENVVESIPLTWAVDDVNAKPISLQLSGDNTRSAILNKGVVSTEILTVFMYQDQQIYVYGAQSNENEHLQEPNKWLFFYVPLMLPIPMVNNDKNSWTWVEDNVIHVRLMLGDADVENVARIAIAKKYEPSISQHSASWDVAPLMIESLTGYIVRGSNSPVEGVYPFQAFHYNSMSLTFRFVCSSKSKAQETMKKLLAGYYEIEVAFFFAAFNKVDENMVTITGDQLKSVISKTSAEGGNTNATFIHRKQMSKFVTKYMANVKKMIYLENPNENTTLLTKGLDDQFISLMKQSMDDSVQTRIDSNVFEQVWSPGDLNPDRITSELNKIFSYNDYETKRHNYSDTYFDFKRDEMEAINSACKISGSSFLFSTSAEVSQSIQSSSAISSIPHNVLSSSEISKTFDQDSVHVEWTGDKLVAKAFSVYQITDLTDKLQVAIVTKQLINEKKGGAVTRTFNARNIPVTTADLSPSTFLIGTIHLYVGTVDPPAPWLLCNGSRVSRIKYKQLYSVIGDTFDGNQTDDNNSSVVEDDPTFALPDFRGRFPVGVDHSQDRFEQTGKMGGASEHSLTLSQLPSHQHSIESINTSAGGDHNHRTIDNGHNHGGSTTGGDGPIGWGGSTSTYQAGSGPKININTNHNHPIPTGYTGISVSMSGVHSHTLSGQTANTGADGKFAILPPFFAVNYIIYADH